MSKHLYFVCPTDYLETTIDRHFQHENYYVSSLGNSVTFNSQSIEDINSLIETKGITEIIFVLADNNEMIINALDGKGYNSISGLEIFQEKITEQIHSTQQVWQIFDTKVPVISHYLNLKIQELKLQLNDWLFNSIKIKAKIYQSRSRIFSDINAEMLYLNHFSLN